MKNAYKKTVKICSKEVEILNSFLYFYPLKDILCFLQEQSHYFR